MPRKSWRRSGFRSGLEKRVKDDLERRKVKFGYEDIKFAYVKEHKYTPDFTLYGESNKIIYLESKGRFDPDARAKMIAVKKLNPEIDLRILFQRDQPLRKGAKTTYSEWAVKHGFKHAFGDKVPQEWLEELD